MTSSHEGFGREHAVREPSNRSFGLVIAGALAVIDVLSIVRGRGLNVSLLVVAAIFLAVGVVRPNLLRPLNRGWMWLGAQLQRVVQPVIMGIMFYGVLTPVGFAMRLTGKDPLRLRHDRAASSYWIPRQPPGPSPSSMPRQF